MSLPALTSISGNDRDRESYIESKRHNIDRDIDRKRELDRKVDNPTDR